MRNSPPLFVDFRFVQSKYDPYLWMLKFAIGCFYVLIYVDDVIFIGFSSILLQSDISKLHLVFAPKQLDDLEYFLGIELKRFPSDSLFLSQTKYIC